MIIGTEIEQFLDEKGASPNCPKWIFPVGENYDFYSYDSGLYMEEDNFSCRGQKSEGGDLNPRCVKCPVRDKIFTELNYHNYLDVLKMR